MATKTGLEKLEETEQAWETHAATDSFYGTTLAQYKNVVKRSRDARTSIASLEQQMVAALNERNLADKEALALEKNIARAIAGDARYGEAAIYTKARGASANPNAKPA